MQKEKKLSSKQLQAVALLSMIPPEDGCDTATGLAKKLNVHRMTVEYWKRQPHFCEAVEKASMANFRKYSNMIRAVHITKAIEEGDPRLIELYYRYGEGWNPIEKKEVKENLSITFLEEKTYEEEKKRL